MNDDYLWDGSGAPDPEVVRLEKLLGRFRHNRPAPEFPSIAGVPNPSRIQRIAWPFAIAAMILFVCFAWWMRLSLSRGMWTIANVEGAPRMAGQAVKRNHAWKIGQQLVTDAESRVELQVRGLGHIDVEPNSRLTLLIASKDHQQVRLDRGTIHASIVAPPYVFLVHTPTAYALDMGCAYTLHVNDDGSSILRVTLGWVDLQHDSIQSLVPAGAAAESRPGLGPGAPYYEDASERFRQALETVNFDLTDAHARPAALTIVLEEARPRDAFTLLNLFRRVDPSDRGRMYNRLATLVPPPAGVTREDAVNGDWSRIDLWWQELGIGSAKKDFKRPPRVEE